MNLLRSICWLKFVARLLSEICLIYVFSEWLDAFAFVRLFLSCCGVYLLRLGSIVYPYWVRLAYLLAALIVTFLKVPQMKTAKKRESEKTNTSTSCKPYLLVELFLINRFDERLTRGQPPCGILVLLERVRRFLGGIRKGTTQGI